MNDEIFSFRSIGTIYSPHKDVSRIPIQPVFCNDIEGSIELEPEYADGLRGLEGFSHIYLFYYFHESRKVCLQLKPYLSDQEQGILRSSGVAEAMGRDNQMNTPLPKHYGVCIG